MTSVSYHVQMILNWLKSTMQFQVFFGGLDSVLNSVPDTSSFPLNQLAYIVVSVDQLVYGS